MRPAGGPMMAAPDVQPLDPLMQLARMAGPETAGELFRQLAADLETTRTGLAQAAAAGDLVALGRHAHVLMALAGTAGDGALRDLAQGLSAGAQAGPRAAGPVAPEADLGPLLAKAESGIAGLIDRVRDNAQGLAP